MRLDPLSGSMSSVRPQQSFAARFDHLLENTAHLLEVHLEVWDAVEAPLSSHRPPAICLDCGRKTPELFSSCQQTRGHESMRAAEAGEPRGWDCERHCRLTAIPIRHLEPRSGAIVSVEAPESSGFLSAGTAPCLDLAVYRGLDPDFLLPERTTRAPWTSEIGPEASRGPLDAMCALGRTPGGPAPIASRRRAFLLDLARLLSDQMCMYHDYAQVNGELSSRYEELHLLYGLAGRLASHDDMREALRKMCEELRAGVDADVALVSMREQRLEEVFERPEQKAAGGTRARAWKRVAAALRLQFGTSGATTVSGDTRALGIGPDAGGVAAHYVAAQVWAKDRPIGVVALLHLDQARSFRVSDVKLLESLAQQIHLSMKNADLYEDLQNFLMATVKSLVSAIEAKDSYTSGHSERVNLISMLLGKTMGLSDPVLETLRWASILHDVGKIGMPECILNKPDRLSPEETRIMMEHPDRGYKVLAPIRQLETPAVSVRSHHEQWNGRGYPLGLSGEDIPLVARIIAVADTWDALTTTRPYRTARTFEFAALEILRIRGTQLDPTVVDAFLTLIPFLQEHHVMIQAGVDSLQGDEAA